MFKACSAYRNKIHIHIDLMSHTLWITFQRSPFLMPIPYAMNMDWTPCVLQQLVLYLHKAIISQSLSTFILVLMFVRPLSLDHYPSLIFFTHTPAADITLRVKSTTYCYRTPIPPRSLATACHISIWSKHSSTVCLYHLRYESAMPTGWSGAAGGTERMCRRRLYGGVSGIFKAPLMTKRHSRREDEDCSAFA